MHAHARLSPSAADRWAVCAPSVRLIERLRAEGIIPQDSTSLAGMEGTAAHQVRADCFDLGLDVAAFVGTHTMVDGTPFEVTEDWADFLQPGIDWARDQPGWLFTEYRVDLGRWLPGQFGTLDTGIVIPALRRAILKDLKFGFDSVGVVNTRQLRIYGMGFWDNVARHLGEIDNFTFVIDQPRNGGLKFWSCTLAELMEFADEIAAAAQAVEDPNAPFVPSEKGCKYCPVKDAPGGCGAYNAWAADVYAIDLLDAGPAAPPPMFPDTDLLTPERRGYIAANAPLAKKWLDKVVADSTAAALAGHPDPGTKLIDGKQGDREYADEAAAEAVLVGAMGLDAFVTKLASPTQAEKALKPGRKKLGNPDAWEALNALITRAEGKPTVVSVDDARPEKLNLAAELAELDELD